MEIITGGVTAVPGFQAAGVAVGIRKNNQKKDLAILYVEEPAVCAGVFTQNVFAAAPVLVSREVAGRQKARAVVANSGVANACTGEQGLSDARRMAALTAKALNLKPGEVFVASTGVIGEYLPMEKVERGIHLAARGLSPGGGGDAALAIMTTDTLPKETACRFSLGGTPVTLGGMAKGSGMIHPNMATMLSFLATDAAIDAELLQEALREAVDCSFNMISVAGDTSTNDMVLILANGRAGNPPIQARGEDYDTFLKALKSVCTELAQKIVRDGEGATKFLEVRVAGCPDYPTARALAKKVLTSSLVKTAFYGEDANWGRMVTALGNSGVSFNPANVSIYLGDLPVAQAGRGVELDEERAAAILKERDIRVTIHMGMGGEEAVAWGCDLSHEYVTINGSYRT